MSATSSDPLAPGTRLKGRYEVIDLIKGGGMSWIYRVREHRQDATTQLWALKELRIDAEDTHTLAEAEQLFAQEAHILVRLSHPNLPRVAAFFSENGRSYLVMEFVHGHTLQEILGRAGGPLPEREVTPWFIQVCAVLQYLHAQRPAVIFRDLKPSNVMVTPSGDIKLIDFGIARTYKVGKLRDTISMGSENYAAPEQWGQEQTDARSDVYAAGATMYHLLANEAPLPAFVPGERIPLERRNAAVSARLAEVIARAMAPERADRYQSAEELRAALIRTLAPWERVRWLGTGTRTQSAPRQPDTSPGYATAEAVAPAPMVSPQPSVYCIHCGAANRQGARYCASCGRPQTARLRRTLTLQYASSAPVRYSLEHNNTVIGRRSPSRSVDIDLGPYDPQGYVSRQHAQIGWHQGQGSIQDLKSSNGTFVNGRRVPADHATPLRHGDVVRIGTLELRYSEEPEV
ncbi:MAG: protein kinase domain-containing protein [Anaerolineae bacterium]|nr:protein kinase [Chloroflexota bacterium]